MKKNLAKWLVFVLICQLILGNLGVLATEDYGKFTIYEPTQVNFIEGLDKTVILYGKDLQAINQLSVKETGTSNEIAKSNKIIINSMNTPYEDVYCTIESDQPLTSDKNYTGTISDGTTSYDFPINIYLASAMVDDYQSEVGATISALRINVTALESNRDQVIGERFELTNQSMSSDNSTRLGAGTIVNDPILGMLLKLDEPIIYDGGKLGITYLGNKKILAFQYSRYPGHLVAFNFNHTLIHQSFMDGDNYIFEFYGQGWTQDLSNVDGFNILNADQELIYAIKASTAKNLSVETYTDGFQKITLSIPKSEVTLDQTKGIFFYYNINESNGDLPQNAYLYGYTDSTVIDTTFHATSSNDNQLVEGINYFYYNFSGNKLKDINAFTLTEEGSDVNIAQVKEITCNPDGTNLSIGGELATVLDATKKYTGRITDGTNSYEFTLECYAGSVNVNSYYYDNLTYTETVPLNITSMFSNKEKMLGEKLTLTGMDKDTNVVTFTQEGTIAFDENIGYYLQLEQKVQMNNTILNVAYKGKLDVTSYSWYPLQSKLTGLTINQNNFSASVSGKVTYDFVIYGQGWVTDLSNLEQLNVLDGNQIIYDLKQNITACAIAIEPYKDFQKITIKIPQKQLVLDHDCTLTIQGQYSEYNMPQQLYMPYVEFVKQIDDLVMNFNEIPYVVKDQKDVTVYTYGNNLNKITNVVVKEVGKNTNLADKFVITLDNQDGSIVSGRIGVHLKQSLKYGKKYMMTFEDAQTAISYSVPLEVYKAEIALVYPTLDSNHKLHAMQINITDPKLIKNNKITVKVYDTNGAVQNMEKGKIVKDDVLGYCIKLNNPLQFAADSQVVKWEIDDKSLGIKEISPYILSKATIYNINPFDQLYSMLTTDKYINYSFMAEGIDFNLSNVAQLQIRTADAQDALVYDVLANKEKCKIKITSMGYYQKVQVQIPKKDVKVGLLGNTYIGFSGKSIDDAWTTTLRTDTYAIDPTLFKFISKKWRF